MPDTVFPPGTRVRSTLRHAPWAGLTGVVCEGTARVPIMGGGGAFRTLLPVEVDDRIYNDMVEVALARGPRGGVILFLDAASLEEVSGTP